MRKVRWSILTAGFIALFWTIWYLRIGQVPIVNSIKITPDCTIQLPFGVSRWWDILPIWSIILISIFTNKTFSEKIKKYPNLVGRLGMGLGFSLVIGVGYALGIGGAVLLCAFLSGPLILGILTNVRLFAWENPNKNLRFNVYLGLLLGLFFGFFLGLCHWENYSNEILILLFALIYSLSLSVIYDLDISLLVGLLSCLTFGLSYGLIECGLLLGLGYGLIISLIACLIISMGTPLKYIFRVLENLK